MGQIVGRLLHRIVIEADFNKIHILIKYTAMSTQELLTQVKDLMLLLQRLRRMSQELRTHIVMHILGI